MFSSLKELTEFMTKPTKRLIDNITKIDGDIMILGAGGKVGPSLAMMAKRAIKEAGLNKRVIAVSIFEYENTVQELVDAEVEVIQCDVMDSNQLTSLPKVKNIIFMVGKKFGTASNESLTWAINTALPVKVLEHLSDSNFVVFSTGNVYGYRDIASGGANEEEALNPVGEYAQSCLGRERIFEYYSQKYGTKVLLLRLNYAIDMRYGVLFDIAKRVYEEQPIELASGYVNVIWQGDVCEYAICSLLHTASPCTKLNVTGPECISTKWLANVFAAIFNKDVTFTGTVPNESLFSNAAKMNGLMGYPHVNLEQMINWVADWVKNGGNVIDAPTHFETVNGKY